MADEETTRSAQRGRSPSYPGVPLSTCVERARKLYDADGKNAAPIDAILRHWGYNNPKTGSATVAVAALKKFGLIEDAGARADRTAKLTTLALDILIPPNEATRQQCLQEAALAPGIHAELWHQYNGELPSDDTLTHELVRNRNFTANGASDFIRQFRETIAFAKLTSPTTVSAGGADDDAEDGDDEDDVLQEHDQQPPPPGKGPKVTVPQGGMVIPIPILGGPPVQIAGQFPLNERDWDQFVRVLEAMKPGLVIPNEPEQ